MFAELLGIEVLAGADAAEGCGVVGGEVAAEGDEEPGESVEGVEEFGAVHADHSEEHVE